MLSITQFLKESNNGLYVCAKFDELTIEDLITIQEDLDLDLDDEKVVKPDDFHATIVYSPTWIDFKLYDDDVIVATQTKIDVFEHNNKKHLVLLLLDADYLHMRHEHAINLGAEYSFDEYKPHITLAYDIGDTCDDFIGITYDFDVVLECEHSENLKQ